MKFGSGKSGVFTNIGAHIKWIKEEMEEAQKFSSRNNGRVSQFCPRILLFLICLIEIKHILF